MTRPNLSSASSIFPPRAVESHSLPFLVIESSENNFQAVHGEIKTLTNHQKNDEIPEIVTTEVSGSTHSLADFLIKLCSRTFCYRFLPFFSREIKCLPHMTRLTCTKYFRIEFSFLEEWKTFPYENFILFTEIITVFGDWSIFDEVDDKVKKSIKGNILLSFRWVQSNFWVLHLKNFLWKHVIINQLNINSTLNYNETQILRSSPPQSSCSECLISFFGGKPQDFPASQQ